MDVTSGGENEGLDSSVFICRSREAGEVFFSKSGEIESVNTLICIHIGGMPLVNVFVHLISVKLVTEHDIWRLNKLQSILSKDAPPFILVGLIASLTLLRSKIRDIEIGVSFPHVLVEAYKFVWV